TPGRRPHAATGGGATRGHPMMSRRSLLLGVPGAALGGTKPHAGAQTNAWTIDPKDFNSLLQVLAEVKRLGFEGFETSFRNVQAQFAKPQPARDELKKTGLRFFGVHVFLPEYDPHTSIGAWDLLQSVADGGEALGA